MNSLISILIGFSLISCAKNEESSGPAPLSEQQKSSFVETMSSLKQSQQAIKDAKPATMDFQPSSTSEMSGELKAKNCVINFQSVDESNRNPGLKSDSISVTGATCPVALDYRSSERLEYSSSSSISSSDLTADYSVKDANYQKWNDISAFHLQGASRTTAVPNGSSWKSSGTGEFSGFIQSVKVGNIPFKMIFKGEFNFESGRDVKGSGNGSVVTTFNFPTFLVELKQTLELTTSGMVAKNYMNNSPISEAEYSSYMNSWTAK